MGYGEKVEHFNFDKRKIGNNTGKTKYDELEIYNYYVNKAEEHMRLTNKKLKISEILPELKSKFDISERSFKRLKSKFENNK